ncbi:helix-turn-helix transcriptional regulator [Methylobacterium phyllosphaerae]
MKTDNRLILALIDQIYAAAVDPALWPIFLDSFTEAFGGEQSTFFSHDLKNLRASFHACARVGDSFVNSYVDYYSETNFFVEKISRVKEGVFVTTDHLASRQFYEQSEFYNDWVKPQGCLEFATTNILRDQTILTGITVLRGSQPFQAREVDIWMTLVPHLQRAVQVHRQLYSAQLIQVGCFEALNRLSVGAILVGPNAEVLFCNQQAERLMNASCGLHIRGNRLSAGTLSATSALQQAIRQAAGTSAGKGLHAGELLAIAGPSGSTLSVLVSPMHASSLPDAFGAQPGALVLLADSGLRKTTRQQDLIRLFGLTRAEARLLHGLVEGRSLSECAEASSTSVQTARAQLKGVFDKMGVHRQTDAVRAVLTNPVLVQTEDSVAPE